MLTTNADERETTFPTIVECPSSGKVLAICRHPDGTYAGTLIEKNDDINPLGKYYESWSASSTLWYGTVVLDTVAGVKLMKSKHWSSVFLVTYENGRECVGTVVHSDVSDAVGDHGSFCDLVPWNGTVTIRVVQEQGRLSQAHRRAGQVPGGESSGGRRMIWRSVDDEHPRNHGGPWLVHRPSTGQTFHAKVCYGMHHPWWVPRNAFTEEESSPINFEPGDLWCVVDVGK